MSAVCDIVCPGRPSCSRLFFLDAGASESHASLQKLKSKKKKRKDTALLPDVSPTGEKKDLSGGQLPFPCGWLLAPRV